MVGWWVRAMGEPTRSALDDDARLALTLLDKVPENAVLLLPSDLDAALHELQDRGLAEIIEPGGIPLASITQAGREEASRV
jgi:hypothetical protein